MVICEGDIILNKNPKKIRELDNYVTVREDDNGKKHYVIHICDRFESHKSFSIWLSEKIIEPVLVDNKIKLNGTVVMTDEVEPNKSGDIIINNNDILFQPVLPMF